MNMESANPGHFHRRVMVGANGRPHNTTRRIMAEEVPMNEIMPVPMHELDYAKVHGGSSLYGAWQEKHREGHGHHANQMLAQHRHAARPDPNAPEAAQWLSAATAEV